MDEERRLIDAGILKDALFDKFDGRLLGEDLSDIAETIDEMHEIKAYTKEDLDLLMKDLKEMADVSPNLDECYGIKIATEVVTRFFGLDIVE